METILLRKPHPPPSPEERGPILQSENVNVPYARFYENQIISPYVNVPLSSGEGLGVRLSEGLVSDHFWIFYVELL
jgi:hypothetical protein